tara:strand:+ start:147 stop:635 length:489 start_codon:yes stop_codon:yes gene_type:complete
MRARCPKLVSSKRLVNVKQLKIKIMFTTIQLKKVKPSHEIARNFDLEYKRIKSIYEGRIDACTCGCEGKFHYTKHYAEYKSQVEGNGLLLPMANDKMVKAHLLRVKENEHTAKFFVQMSGGYCIKVPTYMRWNESEGKKVQYGYIIDLHWKDIKLNQTPINL